MNSPANWDLQIDQAVLKALKKIPQKHSQMLVSAIKLFPVNPYFGDIQKMKGENHTWRRRIGFYRIFYKIKLEQKIILVFWGDFVERFEHSLINL